MPRALRAFKAAALPEGMQVEAAPMGMAARIESPPSTGYRRKRGFRTRAACAARAAGAWWRAR
jgi:hypothetical protein